MKVGLLVNPVVPRRPCCSQAMVISGADQSLFPGANGLISKRGLCRDNPQRQPIFLNPEDTFSKLSKRCRIEYYGAESNFQLKSGISVSQEN